MNFCELFVYKLIYCDFLVKCPILPYKAALKNVIIKS